MPEGPLSARLFRQFKVALQENVVLQRLILGVLLQSGDSVFHPIEVFLP